MEALAQATGPYTVKIVTVGHESFNGGGVGHFLVMDRLFGPNLWDFVHRSGPITDAGALAHLAVVLADGLSDFHARAVTHRDLKPANVMLTDHGPVIVDLGIAKLADVTATMPGSHGFATLGYVAPETILGRGTMAPADVWSWGCCIAYAASGQRLFPGEEWDPVTYAILNGRRNLAAMEAIRRVNPPLADLVWAATDVDPERRPFNGSALLARLPGGTRWPSPARALGAVGFPDATAAVRTMLHS
jgi:serine/threonine protein kinase